MHAQVQNTDLINSDGWFSGINWDATTKMSATECRATYTHLQTSWHVWLVCLSPPQRPSTVALGRREEGKILKSARGRFPLFSFTGVYLKEPLRRRKLVCSVPSQTSHHIHKYFSELDQKYFSELDQKQHVCTVC